MEGILHGHFRHTHMWSFLCWHEGTRENVCLTIDGTPTIWAPMESLWKVGKLKNVLYGAILVASEWQWECELGSMKKGSIKMALKLSVSIILKLGTILDGLNFPSIEVWTQHYLRWLKCPHH